MTQPPPPGVDGADLVLHAAAWTDVDGAEADPQGARLVNVGGTRNVAALGAPVVYYSTDYVFDGSSASRTSSRTSRSPLSVYGRTKLDGEREVREGWIIRSRGCSAGRAQLRPDDAAARRRARRGRGRRRPAGSRPTSATWPRRRASSLELPQGVWHMAAERRVHVGRVRARDLRGGGSRLRVREITTEELGGRPRARPIRSCEASAAGAPASRTGAKASEPA